MNSITRNNRLKVGMLKEVFTSRLLPVLFVLLFSFAAPNSTTKADCQRWPDCRFAGCPEPGLDPCTILVCPNRTITCYEPAKGGGGDGPNKVPAG